MICQRCHKNIATVHVTEIGQADGEERAAIQEQHLCEVCAQTSDLPHAPVPPKTMADIWKLLQISAKKARLKRPSIECPECNMSLEELRRRGRLGCARCYDVFEEYLTELLERMHGSHKHVGRVPGIGEGELERIQRITDLKGELELAIRDEAYERAASIRDELKLLETADGPES